MTSPTKNHRQWDSVDFDVADLFLPDAPGVYIVMGKANGARGSKRPLYVGRAENLRRRWADGHHKALACLREGAKVIRYIVTDDFVEFEKTMIAHVSPPLNR